MFEPQVSAKRNILQDNEAILLQLRANLNGFLSKYLSSSERSEMRRSVYLNQRVIDHRLVGKQKIAATAQQSMGMPQEPRKVGHVLNGAATQNDVEDLIEFGAEIGNLAVNQINLGIFGVATFQHSRRCIEANNSRKFPQSNQFRD
jgi:hypothetical protein